jgi:hypothetical protein
MIYEYSIATFGLVDMILEIFDVWYSSVGDKDVNKVSEEHYNDSTAQAEHRHLGSRGGIPQTRKDY